MQMNNMVERRPTIPKKRIVPPSGKDLRTLVETSLDGDKAEDIVVIDLAGKTEFADYMVIASGQSSRQVGAMAQHLFQKIKETGIKDVVIEGTETCDWVLIDGGDVVVHLFRPEVREYYELEKLWNMPTVVSGSSARSTAGVMA